MTDSTMTKLQDGKLTDRKIATKTL